MNPLMLPLAAFALVSLPAPAQSKDGAEVDCPTVFRFAEEMMKARQAGVSLVDVQRAINQRPSRFQKFFETVALDAYSRPKYYSREVRRDAIRDFANDWATECYTWRSGLSTAP